MVSAPRCPPGARGLLALLLLLPLPGARGQCGTLPMLSRAVPRDTSRKEGFPIGTEMTYRCLDGFVKIPGKSDTVVCLSNSEWSPIGEFCNGACGATPRLKSATLSAEDATKNYCPPGTTVSYVCRPGYEETELRPVITCLENFTWSEAPEFCRRKSCGVPKGPEYVRAVDTTNYLYGARVNIICDEGFRLRGRPFIQCTLKGDQVEWSQLPTCEERPCKQLELENGRVRFTDLRFGATANFSCNEGYRLNGPTSAQCVVVGNGVDWDKELPLCEEIPCRPPPDIPHGSHTGQTVQEFSFGSAVTYKCDQGFSLIGEASIHCTTKDHVNGEWSGPAPECKGQCGTLPTLSRAVPRDTSRTEGFPISTEVTYRCLDGFVKIPGKSDTVACLSNSEWSTIGEFCNGGCGATPRLKSATLSAEDATKNYCPPGTTVSYVCRPGYESTELRPVITCLENFTWSETPEFCRGKSCGVPKGPEHGRAVDITNDRYGASVNIICDDGFRLRGRTFIQCMLNGDQVEWSQLPTCEEMECKPLELENGRVHFTDLQFGTTANFSCNEGYRLNGPTSAQCVVAGNGVDWDKELPLCKAIPCHPPPDIPHGSHTGQSEQEFSFGSAVTYKCDQGFSLTGEASIHCTTKDHVNGEWSGPAPECKGIECKPLELENGRLHFTDLRFGATANFSCNEGYRLIGPNSVQCVVVGNGVDWDKELPLCQVVITQDKPTTVPPKGTEVAGTSSVVITQDKPTTVPPEETEVTGTSSGRIIDTLIVIVIVIVIIIVSMVVNNCTGICAALNKKWQKKKGCYSVNPDSPKHQITTEHYFDMNESKRNLIFKV